MKAIKPKVIHRGNGEVLGIRKGGKTIFSKTLIPKLDLSYGVLPDNWEFKRMFDPEKLPWKLGDETVQEAYCGFTLNRIPGCKRMEWMAELWRVLVLGGKVTIIVPYWSSPRAIQDPNSQWPPFCDQSFNYFNKAFRDVNKEPKNWEGYCDFDVAGGYQFDPDAMTKSDDVKAFWVKHYLNAVSDIHMVLTKREKG